MSQILKYGRKKEEDTDDLSEYPVPPSFGGEDGAVSIADKPSKVDMSERAARIRRGKSIEERLAAIDSSSLDYHMRAVGEMYAPKSMLPSLSGEEFLRRRAAIDVLATMYDDPVKARRRFARMSNEALGNELSMVGSQDRPAIQEHLEKLGVADEAGTRLNAEMEHHMKTRREETDKLIEERVSMIRAASKVAVASQDTSGQLAKDVMKRMNEESGIRVPDTGTMGQLKDIEKRTGSSPDVSTAFLLGPRYGIDASKIVSAEQASQAVSSMAFAELAAGGLRGAERAQFVKSAANMSTEQQQAIAKKQGITQTMMQEARTSLLDTAKGVTEDSRAIIQAERDRDLGRSIKGIAEYTNILQAGGLQVEIDEEVGPRKQLPLSSRAERMEEMTQRMSAISSEAVPDTSYKAPKLPATHGEHRDPGHVPMAPGTRMTEKQYEAARAQMIQKGLDAFERDRGKPDKADNGVAAVFRKMFSDSGTRIDTEIASLRNQLKATQDLLATVIPADQTGPLA